MKDTSNEATKLSGENNESAPVSTEQNTNDPEELEEAVRSALDEQYKSGVVVGMATLARVVMNTLSNPKKTLPALVSDVRRVCLTAINAVKKNETNGGQDG